jgi:hypothetical protein
MLYVRDFADFDVDVWGVIFLIALLHGAFSVLWNTVLMINDC